jgi:hypothetical protein
MIATKENALAASGMANQGFNENNTSNIPRNEANFNGYSAQFSEGFNEWLESDLGKSGISLARANKLGFRMYQQINIIANLNFAPNTAGRPLEGYGIPFCEPETGGVLSYANGKPFVRIRLRHPAIMDDNGAPKEAKYLSPKGSGIFPYILPEVHRFLLDHPDEPVIFTEGEKKTIRALDSGIHVIGLVGIWGWMAGRGDKSLHPMLRKYMRARRPVVMVYDSDAVDPEKAKNFDQCAQSMTNALLDYKTHLKRVNLPEVTL